MKEININIDINADLGEGMQNEQQLMPYISSCNIACGGHAGDISTMRAVVKLAREHQVKIGAHPSFPDQVNFGRKPMDISCADLYTSLKHQIRDLMRVLRDERAYLHHVKPHGALYNLIAVEETIAKVMIEVVKSIALPVKLYVPYGSVIARLASQNEIPTVYEAFADRNYNEDLSLVSRQHKNALITNSDTVFEHVSRMILEQKVKTISGVEVGLKAETFCVHGDHPLAIDLLKDLTLKLNQNHIQIL